MSKILGALLFAVFFASHAAAQISKGGLCAGGAKPVVLDLYCAPSTPYITAPFRPDFASLTAAQIDSFNCDSASPRTCICTYPAFTYRAPCEFLSTFTLVDQPLPADGNYSKLCPAGMEGRLRTNNDADFASIKKCRGTGSGAQTNYQVPRGTVQATVREPITTASIKAACYDAVMAQVAPVASAQAASSCTPTPAPVKVTETADDGFPANMVYCCGATGGIGTKGR